MNIFIIFLYFLFLIVFSIFTYAFIDPGFFYFNGIFTGLAFSQRFLVSTLYVIAVFCFFLFYGFFILKIYSRRISIQAIITIISGTSVILLFSYPTILSYDIFNYMATAKVTFFYGENPYLVMPIEFINDSMLSYTRAANKYALYGPFWILLTSIPFYVSLQNLIIQLFLFKVTVSIFYFLTCYIFYKLAKNKVLLVIFALNPIVLIETFVGGHNDIVMVFFSLCAFYLLKRKYVFLSVLFLILSILIKYASVFLIPIFMYVLWKTYGKKEINWDIVWKYALALIVIIFMLSPFREELYPWYFLWVFPFALLWQNRLVRVISVGVSFGLLFYYVPYMYTGHYLLLPKYAFVFLGIGLFLVMYYFLNRMFKNR